MINWKNISRYIHLMEYGVYSNEEKSTPTACVNLTKIVLNQRSQAQEYVLHESIHREFQSRQNESLCYKSE